MTLAEIAELVHRQLFPSSSGGAPVTEVEMTRTAVSEYAYQTLLLAWKEKREEGTYTIPSFLLKESDPLPVVDNTIDISRLDYFKTLPDEVWLQDVTDGDCHYIKSTFNNSKILDDEALPDDSRRYFVVGEKIKLPDGANSKTLTVVYAGSGGTDGKKEVDEAVGAIVRSRLIEIYGGKVGVKDETNNENVTN